MLRDELAKFERSRVVDDCMGLLESEVAAKRGLSGLAVKAAFKVIGAVKPGFIRAVIDGLLDEFVQALEPFYGAFVQRDRGLFSESLLPQKKKVADALLRVTDKRAHRTEHTTAKKAYEKLRPKAMEHVVEALPNLGKLMDRYIQ